MQALILAGGSGTRFWPLSRRHRPKQLLALDGERSLLQSTVDRLAPLVPPERIWICTTQLLGESVREQLPEVPAEQVLSEPEGRNTAPAIGWSVGCMPEDARDDVVAVLPSDHRFADAAGFRSCLEQAARVSEEEDWVMTLGVTPRWAETGYGYLELGEPLGDRWPGLRRLARFREKPDLDTARAYVDGGRHLWNAGIFTFRGTTLLEHLRRFEPEIGAGLEAIRAEPSRTGELYPTLPSISIDYAVMERLEEIATLPLDCGWSDLGSWQALYEELEPETEGEGDGAGANVVRGDVVAIDSRGNLLYADEGQIAVVGVEDLVVVRTGKTVLVLPRERSQDVRAIVDHLKSTGRHDLL
ncbi:MAG: mannose-1-phosphate guanylyltransferase [Holophagales bacterium]|nr:mannose-1-phosphate guanylyltransferase [Holophagales bacterium]